MNPPQTPTRLVVLLGALIALPALGTDLFVPSLPELARALDAPVSAAQFTLTAYFIGLAAGQLFWGPLSDRLGRRPTLLAGLAMMLACSVLALFMDSVPGVAAARLGQGLAMSSGAVIVRTVVRDLHSHEAAARLLSAVTIVFSIVPIAAPLSGAALAATAGWRAIFWCYTVLAALLIAATVVGLRETAPAERRSMHPADLARTFASILGERRFVAPFLVVVCAQMGVLAWVSSSAFALVRGLGVPIGAYGLMFAFVMLGQIGGAWASSRLVMRLGIARLLRVGAVTMAIAGALAAALAWSGVNHWLAVVLPFMGFLFGTALIVPNATAAALSPFPRSAGAASSLIGAVGFTIGATISAVLGIIFDGTARPMASVAAFAGIAAFFFERRLAHGSR